MFSTGKPPVVFERGSFVGGVLTIGTEEQFGFVVNEAQFHMVKPTDPTQDTSREVIVCSEIDSCFRVDAKNLNCDDVGMS